MKKTNNFILTAILSIITVTVSAQKFKEFKPIEEPFKTFKSPIIKFDSSAFVSNKSYFQKNESQVISRNNGMPILKYTENQDNTPIYKPDSNLKQSLIIELPKGFETPKNK